MLAGKVSLLARLDAYGGDPTVILLPWGLWDCLDVVLMLSTGFWVEVFSLSFLGSRRDLVCHMHMN